MKINKFVVIVCVVLIATFFVLPVSANTSVPDGGSVVAGNELYNLDFVTDNCTVFGMWTFGDYRNTPMYHSITFSEKTGVVFPISEYSNYAGFYRCLDVSIGAPKTGGTTFRLFVPKITTIPTPSPTPSSGNIIISSSPSQATVYIDNLIKGLTPLTVSVPNGEHTILIRIDGYMDYITSTIITGVDQTISYNLEPIPIPEPTMEEETTEQTLVVETPNYEQTIAAIHSQVSQQQEQIAAHSTQINQQSEQIAVQATQLNQQATAIATQAAINEQQGEEINIIQQIINAIKAILGLS